MGALMLESLDERESSPRVQGKAAVPESADSAQEEALHAVQHILTDTDPNEADNRRRARARHISRFVWQTLTAVSFVGFVAVSPVARRAIVLHYIPDHHHDTNEPLLSWMGDAAYWILPFLVPVAAAMFFVWLGWYWWRKQLLWQVAELESGNRSPQLPPRGYLSTFLIYTQTKNAALFSRFFGVVMIYSAAWGLWYGLKLNGFGRDLLADLIIVGLPILEITLAIAILAVGFGIGRDFVPGRVLAKNTIVMGFLATTSQTDYTVAQNDAQPLLEQLRDERPWSFYSFGRAKKGTTR
jgi:hypothetical protein